MKDFFIFHADASAANIANLSTKADIKKQIFVQLAQQKNLFFVQITIVKNS